MGLSTVYRVCYTPIETLFHGSYLQNVRRQVHETMSIIPFFIAQVMEIRRGIHGISVESPKPQGKHIAQSSDV